MTLASSKEPLTGHKYPFGEATFSRITDVTYAVERDVFLVRFESGLSYPVNHSDLKKSNGINTRARVSSVHVDAELGAGFFVTYADGAQAEGSWEWVLEEAQPSPA